MISFCAFWSAECLMFSTVQTQLVCWYSCYSILSRFFSWILYYTVRIHICNQLYDLRCAYTFPMRTRYIHMYIQKHIVPQHHPKQPPIEEQNSNTSLQYTNHPITLYIYSPLLRTVLTVGPWKVKPRSESPNTYVHSPSVYLHCAC